MKVRASVKKICKDCKIGRIGRPEPSNFARGSPCITGGVLI